MAVRTRHPEHGRFRLQRNHQVVIIRVHDSWNLEATLHFIKDFQAIANPLVGSRWAVLTDLRRWELGVPEMEPHMNALDKWCVESGQTVEATILPDNDTALWQLKRMFADTQSTLLRDYFERAEPAIQWLTKQGFETDLRALRKFLEIVPE